MKRAVPVIACLATLVVSGCGSSSSSSSSDGRGGTFARDGRLTGLPPEVPSPDTAQTARLVAGLAAVDPGLVDASAEYTVSVARNVCNELAVLPSAAPDPERAADFLVAVARANGVELTEAQANRAVRVVAETFCPTSRPLPS